MAEQRSIFVKNRGHIVHHTLPVFVTTKIKATLDTVYGENTSRETLSDNCRGAAI